MLSPKSSASKLQEDSEGCRNFMDNKKRASGLYRPFWFRFRIAVVVVVVVVAVVSVQLLYYSESLS